MLSVKVELLSKKGASLNIGWTQDKHRLDTEQDNIALTQGQFELHKLDLDRLIHIDVYQRSLLTPCYYFLIFNRMLSPTTGKHL